MTDKEKEKFIYSKIKEISRLKKWRFKSYFTFKKINNLFFECNFYVNEKNNTIGGYLSYKPYSIDETFWKITGMPENSDSPLSFRADGAFTISSYKIFEFLITIKNINNPDKEIETLLNEINNRTEKTAKKEITVSNFYEVLERENENFAGIITCLIQLENYKKAQEKVYEFKKEERISGFNFFGMDFFDLIIKKCEEKLNIN